MIFLTKPFAIILLLLLASLKVTFAFPQAISGTNPIPTDHEPNLPLTPTNNPLSTDTTTSPNTTISPRQANLITADCFPGSGPTLARVDIDAITLCCPVTWSQGGWVDDRPICCPKGVSMKACNTGREWSVRPVSPRQCLGPGNMPKGDGKGVTYCSARWVAAAAGKREEITDIVVEDGGGDVGDVQDWSNKETSIIDSSVTNTMEQQKRQDDLTITASCFPNYTPSLATMDPSIITVCCPLHSPQGGWIKGGRPICCNGDVDRDSCRKGFSTWVNPGVPELCLGPGNFPKSVERDIGYCSAMGGAVGGIVGKGEIDGIEGRRDIQHQSGVVAPSNMTVNATIPSTTTVRTTITSMPMSMSAATTTTSIAVTTVTATVTESVPADPSAINSAKDSVAGLDGALWILAVMWVVMTLDHVD